MTQLSEREYENLANEIFPGLAMYARDLNLTEKQMKQYRVGEIIMERGFTDASNRFMGMVTTHRITILSNHMNDFSRFEHGTNWGLFVARNNAHFKVLDTYEIKGKTQILLLHLPDDYRWRYFSDITFSIEDDLIKASRKRFENKAFSIVPHELASKNWLDRCCLPLGMNEDGDLFDIEIRLEDQKRKFTGASFREFYHKFVYVDCRKLMDKIMPDLIEKEDTGLILYGYIDEQSGLSFQPICIAQEGKYGFITRYIGGDIMYVIHSGNLENNNYCSLNYINLDRSNFDEFEKNIIEIYDTRNLNKEKTREISGLDQFRNKDYPDNFPVVIFNENEKPEQVWVRISKFDNGIMTGTLLNEPFGKFDIKLGDEIKFYFHEIEKDKLILISPQ
ncbi:DUF2314 domain-containing protein [Peptoniphilus mikwangii]|uniref:DUF2314 domain-containing protein n=1 Tax=Peptoniphilus mikwangii TaxID=1354300 RepID=UPI0003F8ADD3|nr:DUF2314 domain-containing protein [Peptoniphilus mikwangii]